MIEMEKILRKENSLRKTHLILVKIGQKMGYIDGCEMAYPVLPSCYHFLKMLRDSRIKYLGDILRHPDSEESIFMFNPFN